MPDFSLVSLVAGWDLAVFFLLLWPGTDILIFFFLWFCVKAWMKTSGDGQTGDKMLLSAFTGTHTHRSAVLIAPFLFLHQPNNYVFGVCFIDWLLMGKIMVLLWPVYTMCCLVIENNLQYDSLIFWVMGSCIEVVLRLVELILMSLFQLFRCISTLEPNGAS